MINVGVDAGSIERLRSALGSMEKGLPREVATAINATAKKVRTEAARLLKKELNVPVKVLKKAIHNKSKATKENTRAVVGLFKGYPIPLKYFKPKQTKAGGVTYRIDPKLKGKAGKSSLRDAFIINAYNGNVYRRKGKKRGPVEQQYGPSPGVAFEQAGIAQAARKTAADELPKQMERRIRFILLKNAGGLRGNQK